MDSFVTTFPFELWYNQSSFKNVLNKGYSMTLIQRIKSDQITARKQKNACVASILTTLIGEAEMIGKNANREVTDAEVIQTLKKFVKNIDDTTIILGKGEVSDKNSQAMLLASNERSVLEEYLPKHMSEVVLKEFVSHIHADILVATSSPCKMGDIMSVLKQRFDGQYDG